MKKLIILFFVFSILACQDKDYFAIQEPDLNQGFDTTYSTIDSLSFTDVIMNDYTPAGFPVSPDTDTIPYPENSPLEFIWLDCELDTFHLKHNNQYDIVKFNEWKTYDYLGQINDSIYYFYHPTDDCYMKIRDLLVYIEICKIVETQ